MTVQNDTNFRPPQKFGSVRIGHNPTEMYAGRINMLRSPLFRAFRCAPTAGGHRPSYLEVRMSRAFNAVMRVISSLIGVLMVMMGGIWILQGLNLAWGSLSRSFMQGDQHWVFYGAIMLILGVCQVVWSNTRQRE